MSEKGFVLDKFREFNNKIAELEDQQEADHTHFDIRIKNLEKIGKLLDKIIVVHGNKTEIHADNIKELEQIIENLNLDYDMINGNRKGIEKLEKQMLLKADVEKVYKIKSVLKFITVELVDNDILTIAKKQDIFMQLDGEKEFVVQKSAEIGDTPEDSTVGCRQHSKPSEPSDIKEKFDAIIKDFQKIFISRKRVENELIDEFLEDLRKECDKCPNKPFDSPQCTVFLEGCILYEIREKWEKRRDNE